MLNLADAIRRAQEEQGVTLEALRKKAKISNGTFYDLLRERRLPKIPTLRKLKRIGVKHPLVEAA